MLGLYIPDVPYAHVFSLSSSSSLELAHDCTQHWSCADEGGGGGQLPRTREKEREPDKWSHAVGHLLSADPVINLNMEKIHRSSAEIWQKRATYICFVSMLQTNLEAHNTRARNSPHAKN